MLNQMFIDLENATNENGELLDNLLSYMEETIEYTGQAGGAMVDAVETQKNIRRVRKPQWDLALIVGLAQVQCRITNKARYY